MEDDDNEGEKILTIEDFRKRAMDKLEVFQNTYNIYMYIYIYNSLKSNQILIKIREFLVEN
jgi:hypothetical protein